MASDVVIYGGKDMAFSPYNEYWKQTRRICALELFSHKRVLSFQSVREEEVGRLVDRVRKVCLISGSRSTSCVNLSHILRSTSNNIMSRCVIGQRYDTEDELAGGGGTSRFEELAKRLSLLLSAFCVGDLFPYFGWIDVLRGFVASLKSTSRALDAFYNQVIEDHKKTMAGSKASGTKDFMDVLLQLQKDGSMVDFVLTNDHVKAIIQDLLVGGIETTSTTMEWLMVELLRNPRVMKKTQEEVRRVVRNKAKVDSSDIDRMDYLKCVHRETLRLHPAAPLFLPRETSRSVEIGGYHIPMKTKVLVNGWAIHRHPSSWDNPDEFIPERFENSPIDFKTRDYFQLIPFGFGRRQCARMIFGIVNIEYVVSNLLYWFDWKLSTEDMDMGEVFGVVVSKKVPLHAVPTAYSAS